MRGLVFRGATLLAGARVRRPDDLARLHRTIDTWRPRIRASTLAAQAILAVALFVGLGASALLARLFRYGTISYHGAFVSLSCIGGVQALRVDPKCWHRFRKKPRLPSQQEAKIGGFSLIS